MNTTEQKIFNSFKGKLVGTKWMKEHVVRTVSLMTPEIIEYVTKNCWFLASLDDAWAFTFTGNDLRDKHLIFLSDALLHQHEGQIRYSIAHEIGHVMLGHRNSVFIKQSRREINRQEKEADEFAKQFTN